jgi:butyryl-CoA dehydrogenase
MLAHSGDYMQLFSIVTVAWLWLRQAAVSSRALSAGARERDFYEGKIRAAQYWFATEVSRVDQLAALCASCEDSYVRMKPESF